MQWGSSKSLESLRENTNATIVGSKVALPVDLQYHDLAEPLPTRLAVGSAIETIKDYGSVAVNPSAASAYFGADYGNKTLPFLNINGYVNLVIYIKNDTSRPVHLRAISFGFSSGAINIEEGQVMRFGQSDVIEIPVGGHRFISGYDKELIPELVWLEKPPLPYFAFQVRTTTGADFLEGTITAMVFGRVQ